MEKLSLKGEKSVFRRRFRELRKEFAKERGPAAEKQIQSHIKRWLRDFIVPDVQVCAYRSQPDEVNPCVWPLTKLYFPRIEERDLVFYRPQSTEAFVKNRFGILEPDPERAERLKPERPTIVLCPAVAVDSLGRRIGLGEGYYDRFLGTMPQAIRVGVVFHVQVSHDPLPAEGWDQLLDWVITEKMILRVSQRSF